MFGKENTLVNPNNICIKDKPIYHALSDSEAEGTDEEHQQDSRAAAKKMSSIRLLLFGQWIQWEDPIAVILFTATTQSTSSVEHALDIHIALKTYSFCSGVAVIKWTILCYRDTVGFNCEYLLIANCDFYPRSQLIDSQTKRARIL